MRHRLQDFAVLLISASIDVLGTLLGIAISSLLEILGPLGPIIGAFFGAYLATRLTNKIELIIEERRLKNIYNELKVEINSDGWWKHSEKLLYLFEIKSSYFDKTVPNLNTSDDKSLWLTALCFFLLSFFECRKD